MASDTGDQETLTVVVVVTPCVMDEGGCNTVFTAWCNVKLQYGSIYIYTLCNFNVHECKALPHVAFIGSTCLWQLLHSSLICLFLVLLLSLRPLEHFTLPSI